MSPKPPENKKPGPTRPRQSGEDRAHGARTLVLEPVLKKDRGQRDPEDGLAEAVGLAQAIALSVVQAFIVTIAAPAPATLFGRGQGEHYRDVVAAEHIELAVVDHPLSPVQQRNLEKLWACKVIDRTGLILEIFGERAHTKEGQLQVELAALDYQRSRLVRSWTHLERQRGGFGFLGGPGESQLELDRRMIDQRMLKLKDELKQVRRTRGLQREARKRAEHPTIALVGYTNAGKSSLFNRLTGAEAVAKDMLFATLDPAMRGLNLPSGREAIISDTVGFISDLPTHLVEAFRATLEEVQQADAILHVRDVTHPETRIQKDAVMHILADLGIAETDARLIEVLNKIDLLPAEKRKLTHDFAVRTTKEIQAMHMQQRSSPLAGEDRWGVSSTRTGASSCGKNPTPDPSRKGRGTHVTMPVSSDHRLRLEAQGGTVAVSALSGEGIDRLLGLLDDRLSAQAEIYDIALPLTDGAALAWLHAHGKILRKSATKTKAKLKIALSAADYGRYTSKFGDMRNER